MKLNRRTVLKGLLMTPVVAVAAKADLPKLPKLPEPRCPRHKDAFDREDGVGVPTTGLVKIVRTHGFHQNVSAQIFQTEYPWIQCDLCDDLHPIEQKGVPGLLVRRMTVADSHETWGRGTPAEEGCCIFLPMCGWDCHVQLVEHDLNRYHESSVITMNNIDEATGCYTIDLRNVIDRVIV